MSAQPQESAASLQSKISQLKETIEKVASLKKALKQNAMEVKSEIQSSVSRQLEWLRSRELHLLEQVELIQTAKEELLSQQQDHLHQALGGLHSSFDGQSPDSPMVDMLSEESPHIRFHADAATLRNSIREFGQVDSAVFPFASKLLSPLDPFPPSHLGTAASLPKPFEEYDDDEHHVLYKPVDNGSSSSIHVNIPKLSNKPLDWLAVPTEPPAPASPSAEARFIFPPFQKSEVGQQWLQKGAEGNTSTAGSLHQWLLDLQDQATLEEEDGFEMLGNHQRMASVSSSDIEVLSLSALSKGHMDTDETVEVKALCDGTVEKEPEAEVAEMAYFKTIPTDPNHWLLQKKEPEAMKSSCSNTCLHAQSSPMQDVDIENLDHLLCVSPSNPYPAWKLTETEEDERDVDEEAARIGGVCRANEVCSTFSDCVCDENCAEALGEKSQEWLMKPKSVEEREELLSSPLCAYMKWMAQQDWLMQEKAAEVEESPVFQYFQNLAGEGAEKWLKKESNADQNPWLLQRQDSDVSESSSTATYSITTPESNCNNNASDTTQWLLKKSLDDEEMLCKSLKEKWLLSMEKNSDGSLASVKRSPFHSLDKAAELPEYADSESGGDVTDHEELFLCFKKAMAKTELSGWLLKPL